MNPAAPSRTPYLYLAPPYRRVLELEAPSALPLSHPPRGEALVWNLSGGRWGEGLRVARDRPAGLALIIVLPRSHELDRAPDLLEVVEQCRPQSLLPYHPDPAVDDLVGVLRRPPESLPIEVTDYLTWRGIHVDGDTRHLMRRTIDLSADLRTVSGLSRSLYMSRRALGRRFLSRGLPVPSHWLHFSRVLRASIKLQNSDDSLFSIACELGYSDGFALSNQMKRLTGVRPSQAREWLGWEWIVEAWLRTEARDGAVKPISGYPVREVLAEDGETADEDETMVAEEGERVTPAAAAQPASPDRRRSQGPAPARPRRSRSRSSRLRAMES